MADGVIKLNLITFSAWQAASPKAVQNIWA
jgi:hypothetical protein